MIPAIPLPRLSRAQREDLQERRRERARQKMLEHLPLLLDVCSVFTGEGGKGKTLGMVTLANNLMRHCGVSVVGVGTNMEITGAFNEGRPPGVPAYQHLTEKDFLDQLNAMEKVASELRDMEMQWLAENPEGGMAADPASVLAVYRQAGIVLVKCVILFDESFRLFDSYRSGDKFNIVSSQFVDQRRHLETTLFFATPTMGRLPRRVRDQIVWEIQPSLRREKTRLELFANNLKGTAPSFTLQYPTAAYFEMYHSHSRPQFRTAYLKKAEGSF